MNDTTTQIVGGGGALAVVVMFFRWAMALWAEVRREDIAAGKETAAAARETSSTMVAALLAQARSNEQLAGEHAKSTLMLSGKIDALIVKLDTIADWRERTPVEGIPLVSDDAFTNPRPGSDRARRRLRTVPQGHRTIIKPDRNDE